MAEYRVLGGIKSINKTSTHYLIQYTTCESAMLNILNDHVFKFHVSATGDFHEHPTPKQPEHAAKITFKSVAAYGCEAVENSTLTSNDGVYTIETPKIKINFQQATGLMTIICKTSNIEALKEIKPLSFTNNTSKQVLHADSDEYFFGGGMQNGRFSHKCQKIMIENSNTMGDGDVTSPCAFYWSSKGYGVLRNTWQPGVYDFGLEIPTEIETVHNTATFDAYYFINPNPKDILGDYYELTGRPILLPEYAFYEAHSNAFNRDYWVEVTSETPGAILFEDEKYYKKFKPNELKGKVGVLESLNGENDNYQFSARAVIDRYKIHNMPLGWIIPNDGYDCGYGQTNSFEGDLQNLKEFQHYAREDGIEVALWTQSDLVPADPEHPKKGERDFAKEVQLAGVRGLKCDISWVGEGYSHGLHCVEQATKIFNKAARQKARPVIITTRGWAGTHRYAGVWSGNQSGGQWQNIRFHVPTFIGASLSGLPVIGSDVDGVFDGGAKEINIRDFQWKSFTPLQLNMDGWGTHPKNPFSFDYEATSINRAYLKLKSMLMPYNYTIGYEAIHGLPMVRAMFLEFPKEVSAYTKISQYQFMWGPSILVAPVYKAEPSSNTVRQGIYLPDENQVWIEFLTGDKYQGGRIYNTFKTPIWKLPIFIKDGAIIPITKSNNNPNEIKRQERLFLIYPNGKSSFEVYEDDGISLDYVKGMYAKTNISISGPRANEEGDLTVHIHKTEGCYNNMVRERSTIIKIQTSKDVSCITATVNGETHNITKVCTCEQFKAEENVYFYTKNHAISKFLLEFGGDELKQEFLLIKIGRTDVLHEDIVVKIKDYTNTGNINGIRQQDKSLHAPNLFTVPDKKLTATSITLEWQPIKNANYEIEGDGVILTDLNESSYTFKDLLPGTQHKYKIRTISDNRVSKWSYAILVETKKGGPTHLVQGLTATCSVPSQPGHDIEHITSGQLGEMWHTDFNRSAEASIKDGKVIKLNFDLQKFCHVHMIEYFPREDAGNGTFTQVKYRVSWDREEWSDFSQVIQWERNNTPKRIILNGLEMRYFELHVLESVGGFGSGRSLRFFEYDN